MESVGAGAGVGVGVEDGDFFGSFTGILRESFIFEFEGISVGFSWDFRRDMSLFSTSRGFLFMCLTLSPSK